MEQELEKLVSLRYSPELTLDRLKNLFDNQDIDYIFVRLIEGYHLSTPELKKLWGHIQVHGTYQSITKIYLLNRKRKNFSFFFTTLLQLFEKTLDLEELKTLEKIVSELSSKTKIPIDDIQHYISTSIGEISVAPKPPWVDVREGENLSLLTTVSAGGEVSEKRFQNLLDESTDIFHSFVYEPSSGDEKGTFVKEKIPLNIRETIQTFMSGISSVEVDPEDEILANRVFGPQNRFKDKNCPYNLNEIGPCRMLNCYCRGKNETSPDVDSGIEWFDGFCDVCSSTILNKSHAVRYPFKNGGWIGVFCSFRCLHRSIFFSGAENIDQMIRLENLKSTLMEHGIMDRTAT